MWPWKKAVLSKHQSVPVLSWLIQGHNNNNLGLAPVWNQKKRVLGKWKHKQPVPSQILAPNQLLNQVNGKGP